MWETCAAFRKYAKDTTDLLFALEQPLRAVTDAGEVSHQQQSVMTLLTMENYAFLHMIIDASKFPFVCLSGVVYT